jgi:hypothetical protein
MPTESTNPLRLKHKRRSWSLFRIFTSFVGAALSWIVMRGNEREYTT